MKKLYPMIAVMLSLLTAAGMLFMTACASSGAAEASARLLGDADGDGMVHIGCRRIRSVSFRIMNFPGQSTKEFAGHFTLTDH